MKYTLNCFEFACTRMSADMFSYIFTSRDFPGVLSLAISLIECNWRFMSLTNEMANMNVPNARNTKHPMYWNKYIPYNNCAEAANKYRIGCFKLNGDLFAKRLKWIHKNDCQSFSTSMDDTFQAIKSF